MIIIYQIIMLLSIITLSDNAMQYAKPLPQSSCTNYTKPIRFSTSYYKLLVHAVSTQYFATTHPSENGLALWCFNPKTVFDNSLDFLTKTHEPKKPVNFIFDGKTKPLQQLKFSNHMLSVNPPIQRILFDCTSNTIMCLTSDNNFYLWIDEKQEPLFTIENARLGNVGDCTAYTYHTSKALMALGCKSGLIIIIEGPEKTNFSYKEIPLNSPVKSMVFDDKALYLAVYTEDSFYIVNIEKKSYRALTPTPQNIETFSFSPKTNYLIISSQGHLSTWNIHTGSRISSTRSISSQFNMLDVL